jgi:hypothetical protein
VPAQAARNAERLEVASKQQHARIAGAHSGRS